MVINVVAYELTGTSLIVVKIWIPPTILHLFDDQFISIGPWRSSAASYAKVADHRVACMCVGLHFNAIKGLDSGKNEVKKKPLRCTAK